MAKKWRQPCAAGIYPFTDGQVEDFDPIFARLVELSADDPTFLRRPDEHAKPFFPVTGELVRQAEQAERDERIGEARDLFLRAAPVYRMARFPVNRSQLSNEAWTCGKAAYEKGGLHLDPPSVAIDVPFSSAKLASGDQDAPIKAYVRMPKGDRLAAGWPVLLFICGLDAYRTDHTPHTQAHVDQGFATLKGSR